MVKEINLLPKENVGILQQEQTIIIVRAISLLSVVIVICSIVGVFILGKNYSISSVNSQEESVRNRLHTFNGKITKQLTLVDRAKRIQKILKTRSQLSTKLELVQKQLPSDIDINSLSITNEDLNLSVSSSSLTSLKKFLDSMTAMVAAKTFLKRLTINDVVVNAKTGFYTVSVEGTLL